MNKSKIEVSNQLWFNPHGLKNASMCMQMAAMAYNLRKYLKYSSPGTILLKKIVDDATNNYLLTCTNYMTVKINL